MANTYKALASVTVGTGSTPTVTFSNIPQTYTDLVILASARGSNTSSSYGQGTVYVVNTDTNAYNYARRVLQAYDASADANFSATTNGFPLYSNNAGNVTANVFSNHEHYFPNYTNNTSYKVVVSKAVVENDSNNSGASGWVIQHTSNIWRNSAPITSISITADTVGATWMQHSTFTLYGVFNADVSSAPATPTIGTASALGEGALVPFTPVSNAASYVATSSPGSITSTGTTSPLYVSGLSPNTAYTFTVRSQNPFGLSGASAASNSITTATDGWENLGSAVSNGTTTTAQFTSISQSYKHLAILYSIRTSQTGGQTEEQLWMRFNTVGGTSYGWQTTYSREDLNNVVTQQQPNLDAFYRLVTPSSTTAAGTWGYGIIYIYNYANTNMNKNVSALTGYSTPTNTSSAFNLVYMSGVFNSTNAISSVQLQGGNARTWANGSRISLYGIRG